MPNVRNQNNTERKFNGREDILVKERDGRARDDLKGAYAGDQNKNVLRDHSTHEKARKTEKSKTRTPVR